MGRQKEVLSVMGQRLRIRNKLIRQALAECLGTLVLVLFGCGSVAQIVLSRGSHGAFLTVNLAFGFAVTLGILIAGQISGSRQSDRCRLSRPHNVDTPACVGKAVFSSPSYAQADTLNPKCFTGGHLNPAVTFAMCFMAREPWIKLPVYALAQTLGAFLGAGIVFGLYYDGYIG
ncbi:UNVERIFIED_CONTAM: Aquaporin-3 [Gekko kuhli]